MRYTFLLYNDESAFTDVTEEQMDETKEAFGAYIGAMQQAGVLIDTDWLQSSSSATTLSLRGGTKTVQDGPYADTKEQLGGTFAIDVPDLDAALSWAEQCPTVHYGIIEIRASAMPADDSSAS